jgi:hypothetical protein
VGEDRLTLRLRDESAASLTSPAAPCCQRQQQAPRARAGSVALALPSTAMATGVYPAARMAASSVLGSALAGSTCTRWTARVMLPTQWPQLMSFT